jgi:hypothetical protein
MQAEYDLIKRHWTLPTEGGGSGSVLGNADAYFWSRLTKYPAGGETNVSLLGRRPILIVMASSNFAVR